MKYRKCTSCNEPHVFDDEAAAACPHCGSTRYPYGYKKDPADPQ